MKNFLSIAAFALLAIIAPQSLAAQGSGTENGHEWVDLGLPSGTLWATCNIGADKPEDYGSYFAWGETVAKAEYSWNTYKWGSALDKLTKYCNDSSFGKDGFKDDKLVLDPEDDAASVYWGRDWRMPTIEQIEELRANTNVAWIDNYNDTDVNGYKFTNKNDASKFIFMPAAGGFWGIEVGEVASYGFYWTSSVDTLCMGNAFYLGFNLFDAYPDSFSRFFGHTVRPVQNTAAATGISAPLFSDDQKKNLMYNVFGQKVNEKYKGIIIRNGRKFIKH